MTPIQNEQGQYFCMNTQRYAEFLHTIDKEMAGNFMGVTHFSEDNKKQFILRNSIEEAIASSQLEGANTSRSAAKKMLLEGAKPHGKSEIMIVNNHQAMLYIEQELYKNELSFEILCELHKMVTAQTLQSDLQGKLRETYDAQGNRLKVIPFVTKEMVYITPNKEFVEAQLPRLIDFANDKKIGRTDFIHPLIKGILLHFWIGLLHPFEDGNGRLARLIFYWYLLRHGYWAFKYLSLSEKIKKSSVQYAKSYFQSEDGHCDLTYFLNYNIEKLKLARKDFQIYLSNKIKQNQSFVYDVQEKYQFNERQMRLLHYLYQNAESRTNLIAYQSLYAVKKGTAIADLKELTEKGLLSKKKIGRNTYYYPTKELSKLFD
jgi:Fic family protein